MIAQILRTRVSTPAERVIPKAAEPKRLCALSFKSQPVNPSPIEHSNVFSALAHDFDNEFPTVTSDVETPAQNHSCLISPCSAPHSVMDDRRFKRTKMIGKSRRRHIQYENFNEIHKVHCVDSCCSNASIVPLASLILPLSKRQKKRRSQKRSKGQFQVEADTQQLVTVAIDHCNSVSDMRDDFGSVINAEMSTDPT